MPAPLRDVPQDAVELIKSFEGLPDGDPSTVNIDAYLDPVGIWTIGWGHAIKVGNDFLRGAANKAKARAMFPGGITREQAEALLRGELVEFAAGVLRLVKVPLDDTQFGALVSFGFNCGLGNLGASTLLRKLNARDYAGAAEQFLVWDKGRVNGVLQVLPGLARRRRAERALFLGQDWRAASATRSRAAEPMGSGKPEAPKGEGDVSWRDDKPPRKRAAKKAAVKKAAAKKAPSKKAAAKKAPAKKAPAKKAPAKKAAAKKKTR